MDFITKHLDFLTKFFLNNSPEDMSVQDTTVWASTGETTSEYSQAATAVAQVEIVIDAILPNGNFFYDGDDSFVTPDIDRDVTDTISGIVITKDVNNNIIKGDYKIDYKVQVIDSFITIGTVRQFADIGGGIGRVELPGDWSLQLAGETLLTIIDSDTNDGIKTLGNYSYDASTNVTRVDFTAPLVKDFTAADTQGSLEITYTHVYEISKTLNYNYVATAGEIILTADCDKSELRSEDVTDYSQYDNNAPITRNHVLRYPVDLVPSQADVTSQNAIISINPIYTNTWTATIAPVVEITQTDDLVIQDTLDATESIDVQCDDQWCSMFSCLENIGANYEKAIENGSQSEIQRWEQSWDKIQGYHMLWRIARSCGDSVAAAKYTDLALIEANAQDCCSPIDTTPSEPSRLIQAITEGGVTTIYNELVNQWFSGSGVPSPAVHDNGDFYLNTVGQGLAGNGDVYLKAAGSWTIETTIAGDNGTNGTDGTDGTDGIAGLRGSQFYGEDDPVSLDPAGSADGDFNIKPNATIQKRGLVTPDVWAEFADPNGLRGSQIFNINALPTVEGLAGDYNIRANAIIDFNNAGTWEVYADPNGVAGVSGLYSDTVEATGPTFLNTWEILRTHTTQVGEVAVGDTLIFTFDIFLDIPADSENLTRMRIETPGVQFTYTFPIGYNMASFKIEISIQAGVGNNNTGQCLWTVMSCIHSNNVNKPVPNAATVSHFAGQGGWIGDITAAPIKWDFNIYTDHVGQVMRSQGSRIEIVKKS